MRGKLSWVEWAMAENPQVLHFDPLQPVYLLDLNGDALTGESLRQQDDLHDGIGLGILSPWKAERCLPGVARGGGGQYFVDLGKSLASVVFDKALGWGCNALVPREMLMSNMAKDLLEKSKATSGSFTEKLVKRAKKPKKKKAIKKKAKKKTKKTPKKKAKKATKKR
jgi:hypothetical protein